MKRGTLDHPKAREFAESLSLRRYEIAGILESLWHFAAAYAKRGDVGRFPDERIAKHIEWRGDAAELVAALVRAGWLDRCKCHRLRVHDWKDHADQTVTRSEEVKKRGFLECYALPDAESLEQMLVSTSVNESPASQSVPLPLPVPKPKPVPGTTAGPSDTDRQVAECYRLVDAIRDHPKLATSRLWPTQAPDADGAQVMIAASEYKGRGIVNPASMTEGRRAQTIATLRKWLAQLEAARASPPVRETVFQRAEREAREDEAKRQKAATA